MSASEDVCLDTKEADGLLHVNFEAGVAVAESGKKYAVSMERRQNGNYALTVSENVGGVKMNAVSEELSGVISFNHDKRTAFSSEQLDIVDAALQKMEKAANENLTAVQNTISYDVGVDGAQKENISRVHFDVIEEHAGGKDMRNPEDVYVLSADEIVVNKAQVDYADTQTGQKLLAEFSFDNEDGRVVADIYQQKSSGKRNKLISFKEIDNYKMTEEGAELRYIQNLADKFYVSSEKEDESYCRWEALGGEFDKDVKNLRKVLEVSLQHMGQATQKMLPSLKKREQAMENVDLIKNMRHVVQNIQQNQIENQKTEHALKQKTQALSNQPQITFNYVENEYTKRAGEPNVSSVELVFKNENKGAAFDRELMVQISYQTDKNGAYMVADVYSQSNLGSGKLNKLFGDSVRHLSRKHKAKAIASIHKDTGWNGAEGMPIEDFEKVLSQTRFKSDVPALQQVLSVARKQLLAELPKEAARLEHDSALNYALAQEKRMDKQQKEPAAKGRKNSGYTGGRP